MATQTPNLGLTKPELTDEIPSTILALAANFGTLDSIVERAGDDAAGYVRLADGTQIAWVNVVTDAMNVVIGSLFASSYTAGVPWPAAFAGTPVTMAVAVSNSGNSPRWLGQGTAWGSATHTSSAWAVTFASTSNTATLRYLGFGRWK